MADSFVIWTETDSDRYAVDLFDGVAVVTPGAIVIGHVGTLESRDWVQALRNELREVLLTSGLAEASRDGGTVQSLDPTAESFFGERDRQKLLTLVCDRNTPLANRRWFATWQASATDSVLPIMPAGANPSTLLPTDDLRKINVAFWSKLITESVPAVLSRAGLTPEEHRVFISYRRVETQPLAEQLFDRLTHEGFDVFLDRFSIEPGLDFQRRLHQELADKAMVVLLESSWVQSSKWTQHEIDYTKRFRLGLLALRLPFAGRLPTIDVDFRLDLKWRDFEKLPTREKNPLFGLAGEPEEICRWGRLKPTTLDPVVARVKWTHDRAIFRRRHYLRDTMIRSLRAAGVLNPSLELNGLLVAKAVDNSNRYSIWMTTRPPELGDFHTTYPKTLVAPASTGVIIGPTALLESKRIERLEWLRDLCNFQCLDEAEINNAAQKIKEGNL